MLNDIESSLTPWQKIGRVIKNASSIKEGIEMSGLNWNTLSISLRRSDNGDSIDDIAKLFVRSDNGQALGIVGSKTYPLQNEDAFDFFEPYIKSGEVSLETAGYFRRGRRVWVLAKINRENSVIVPGDEVSKFILISNSHDGSTAVRIGFTPIRVVCANTLAAAHANKASKLIRVRHSKKVKNNVDNIREVMNLANAEFEESAELYRSLARKNINATDLKNYVKAVFELGNEAYISKRSKKILNNILRNIEKRTGITLQLLTSLEQSEQKMNKIGSNILEDVIKNFESGRGTENIQSRGTLWTAYNAVNEFFNYQRGNNDESRLESLWFGQSYRDNNKALNVALSML